MNKALYAGSFDPLTCGHLDLIRRAAKICDRLVVGVIDNPSKVPLFSVAERVAMIREAAAAYPNVSVDHFSGLLAEYVNRNDFDIVVRGLRGSMDFASEIQMAQMNARLYESRVETIFLMTDPGYSYFSSSMAKEVYSLGGDIEGLVPDVVAEKMKEKFNGGK
ncbi:MAG: pantetheine-phosphate adenylyltransferase [Anaerovoracaceae bacterium]|jgi:pantetheine-phosphate adenylyltransferase